MPPMFVRRGWRESMNTESPEIAKKVLAADLRSLIKKVSEGGTLSPAAREMMEACLAGAADPGDLSKARSLALVRKWCRGGRLTAEEKSEVKSLLPDPAQITKRLTRETYKHHPSAYDTVYGIKPNRGRTINRWIETGKNKEPPDLPPLDEPERMADWWGRNMKHRVPHKLLLLAKPADQASPPPPAAGKSPAVSPRQAAAGRSPAGDEEEEMDNSYAATIERMKKAVGKAWQNKIKADETEDQAQIEMADRALDRATKRYREFERDAESILGREEKDWKETEKYFTEPLTIINRSIRSAMIRVATKVGLPPEWFNKCERAYQSELDTIFRALGDDDYRRPHEPAEPLVLTSA